VGTGTQATRNHCDKAATQMPLSYAVRFTGFP
jgi:hypothetical protein